VCYCAPARAGGAAVGTALQIKPCLMTGVCCDLNIMVAFFMSRSHQSGCHFTIHIPRAVRVEAWGTLKTNLLKYSVLDHCA
jgi:hypothetical protein